MTAQAVKVLRAVIGKDASLEITEAPIGAAGIAATGDPLPAATLELARNADAILWRRRRSGRGNATVRRSSRKRATSYASSVDAVCELSPGITEVFGAARSP